MRKLSPEARQHAAEKQADGFVTLACSAKKSEGAAFRAWCAERGLSVHAALLEYVRRCVDATDAEAGK